MKIEKPVCLIFEFEKNTPKKSWNIIGKKIS